MIYIFSNNSSSENLAVKDNVFS